MNVLDLFSGIGGFSLGLERAGFTTKYFCEIEPYCRRVLATHWPDVPCFSDVRTLRGTDVEDINLICGGFPCQDISLAGKGAGLSGERSGLWFQYVRIIEEVHPSYVLIENVSALRSRGLDQVLGSLAALGYDAEWHCIPASAVGAPHRRDRVWIVAYAQGNRAQGGPVKPWGRIVGNDGDPRAMAHSWGFGLEGSGIEREAEGSTGLCGRDGQDQDEGVLADAFREQSERGRDGIERRQRSTSQTACDGGARNGLADGWWESEPNVGRVAHGIPARVDRLRGLGNAIVPQIAEILGRAILAHAQSIRLNEEVFS